jgi:probable F420-dependent oxidoreductase
VRFGIVTPVLTRLPGAHAAWERTAGLAEVVEVARAADRLGYHHLTCSEHVAVPADVAEVRGGTYWDPLATFGYLAAVTSQIRLATHVLVLGYHHPLAIAKRYGTLDVVSGGRLILGVGVGTLAPEFELLGAPFADRGRRADEALVALRASLGRREPPPWPGWIVDPCAVQADMPIWVGGRTGRSLRRALALADGWAPFGLRLPELASLLAPVDWPDGFEVVLDSGHPLDPAGDPSGAEARVRALAEVGATMVNARFVHHSVAHYVEQLEALQSIDWGAPTS